MNDNSWIEVRNSAGHLLFRYNPFTNEIVLRLKGVTYELVKLDEIRSRYGRLVDNVSDGKIVETILLPAKPEN